MEASTLLWIAGTFVATQVCNSIYQKGKANKLKEQNDQLRRQNQKLQSEVSRMKSEPENPRAPQSPEKKAEPSRETVFAAKKAFTKYIGKFAPYLSGLEVNDYNKEGLSDEIVSLNDKALIEFWRFYQNRSEELIKIFGRWGISFNNTGSFVCNNASSEYYESEDGCPLEVGVKYKVLKAFWLQTSNTDNSQRLIVKGIVKKTA